MADEERVERQTDVTPPFPGEWRCLQALLSGRCWEQQGVL